MTRLCISQSARLVRVAWTDVEQDQVWVGGQFGGDEEGSGSGDMLSGRTGERGAGMQQFHDWWCNASLGGQAVGRWGIWAREDCLMRAMMIVTEYYSSYESSGIRSSLG